MTKKDLLEAVEDMPMAHGYLKQHSLDSITDEIVRKEYNKNKLSELKRPCENFKPKED